MSEDPTATRRPIEPAVEIELPSECFVGHILGRNGRLVRRLLAEHDRVCRIHAQGAKVLIVGKQHGLQEDVEAVAVKVRYQVFTTIYQSWKYLSAASRGRRPRRAREPLHLGFPPPWACGEEEEEQQQKEEECDKEEVIEGQLHFGWSGSCCAEHGNCEA